MYPIFSGDPLVDIYLRFDWLVDEENGKGKRKNYPENGVSHIVLCRKQYLVRTITQAQQQCRDDLAPIQAFQSPPPRGPPYIVQNGVKYLKEAHDIFNWLRDRISALLEWFNSAF